MKDRAKTFALICFGLMCLSVAVHVGIDGAKAQGSNAISLATFSTEPWVLTDSGDIYWCHDDVWDYVATWSGGVRTQDSSWSEVKSKFGDD